MKMKSKNMNRGAAILSIIFALLFFILAARFIQIQATGKVDGHVLAAKAEEQYTKKRTIEAHRGTIFDRTGEIIAQDTTSYTMVAILDKSLTVDKDHPRHVVDPHETARKLAPLLKMDVEEVESILTKNKKQVEFGPAGRDISFQLKQKIEKLNLPGIAFIRDSRRYYPNGKFASHVIGYTQKIEKDNGKYETVGMMGLEKSLDKYLKEKDGYVKYLSDQKGIMLPNTKESIVPPDNGNNVYLTIDQKIQTFLEDSMNRVMKEYKPKKIIGIVADPKTGKILAMGSRPSFDPNKKNIHNYYNDAVAYRYEPGSTMKIFTLAAAIEEGVFNPNEYYQSGVYKVGPNRIRDHNKRGWGTITYLEGVQRSSNVAFAKIANEKLGTDRLLQYLHRFGFHQKTGIDIPGEAESRINYKWELDKISTAFGQGSAITPIQQIQAATAIANKGKMMKPYVIDRIVDPDTGKVVLEKKPEVIGTPISEKTAKEVLNILETVVTSEKGTGQPYHIEGYDVAGKTGTAQIPSPNGGYLRGFNNFIFSFLGMAPKDDPRVIVYVAVQQPKLSEFESGSAPVSAIFNPVMKNTLQYLNIQPTNEEKTSFKKEKSPQGISVSSLTGLQTNEAIKSVKNLGLEPVVIGNGEKVIDQYPFPKEHVIAGEKIMLKTDGKLTMPDLKGWSQRDVMKLASLLKLKPSLKGNGYVVHQNISAGAVVKENDYLIVELMDPLKQIKQQNIDEEKEEEKKPMD
jgi:penicillin-binding protein 2B